MNTIDTIKSVDNRLKKVKSIVKDFRTEKLTHEQVVLTLIPNLRFINQIGATSFFHRVLESLGEEYNDEIEVQICKMLDCYESFDYVGMALWLQKIRTHQNLTLEQRAVVAINTVFSRPREQCGYAMSMSENENFEDSSTYVEFKHYPEINEFIFNYTNRSRKLFPDDILQSKAEKVINSKSFSKAAYDMAIIKYYHGTPNKTVEEWMMQEDIHIVEAPIVRFNETDMENYRSNLPQLLEAIQNNILVLSLGFSAPDGVKILYSNR